MNFEIPKETITGKVLEVTIGATSVHGGTRTHTVEIGGSTALPFHFFEGHHPHPPRVAMEVFDKNLKSTLLSFSTLSGMSLIIRVIWPKNVSRSMERK